MEVGDFVVNEYGNHGEILELHRNEALVAVCDYGIKDDYDFCDIRKCTLIDDVGTIISIKSRFLSENPAIDKLGIIDKIDYTEDKNLVKYFCCEDIVNGLIKSYDSVDSEYLKLKMNWFIKNVSKIMPKSVIIKEDKTFIDWSKFSAFFGYLKKDVKKLQLCRYLNSTIDLNVAYLNSRYFNKV